MWSENHAAFSLPDSTYFRLEMIIMFAYLYKLHDC